LQLTIPVVILIALGIYSSFLKNRIISISLLLAFLISGPFFIFYAGFPLSNSFLIGVNERFFLMSTVVALLFVPYGILFFAETFNKLFKKKSFERLFIGIFILIPLSLFFYNFPKTNLSNLTIGDDLAYDYLSPLPKNSVLIIGGDTPLLNTWYVHYALSFRKDVTVVNLNALRLDPLYEKERSLYLKNNPKDSKNKNLRLKVLENLAKKRPVFASDIIKPEGEFEPVKWVPYGLTHKLYLPGESIPKSAEFSKKTGETWDGFRYFKNLSSQGSELSLGSFTISDIPSYYASALLLTGNFVLSEYKNNELALFFFKSVINTDGNYYKGYETLGIYYLGVKDCIKSKESLEKARRLYPVERTIYYFLYFSQKCLKDQQGQNDTVKKFNNIFGTDFFKTFKDVKK
jgi:hypothetical protein